MADVDDNFVAAGEKKKFANAEDRTKDKYGDSAGGFTIKGDARFKDGMIREGRKCTDILCLIIFLTFLGAMGYATHYGFHNGNIEKLTAPLDGNGHFCGFANSSNGFPDGADYKYLYLSNIIAGLPKPTPGAIFATGVCVKKCPTMTTQKTVECYKQDSTGVYTHQTGKQCVPDVDEEAMQCAPYNSDAVAQYCIPTKLNTTSLAYQAMQEVKNDLMSGVAGKSIKDLVNAKDAMLISFGMSFVYSLIFLYLMSAFAEPIAWFCVFLIQVGLLGASLGSLMEYKSLTTQSKAEKDQTSATAKKLSEEATGALALGIFIGLLACIFFTCVVCGRKHLALAIDVIDASADFTAENKRVILVPIVYFFISLIFLVIWIGAMACVASLNDIEPGNYTIIPQDKEIKWTKQTQYMGLFMLFGILWILAFIDYTSRFIVMASAVTYYFNSNAEKDGSAELGYAIKIAHLNHAGSIAFGSFIIAVVQFIELVFMYFAKKAEQAGGDNQVIKLVVCIGECILKCIEKIVDYINSAAFCYMAVTGDSFCSSAWNGFLLNVKHCLKFTFANLIAKVFILLGKIAITVGNCFSLCFVMKHVTKTTVSSIWGPVIIVGAVSFFTASLFLGIFETAVMALMTCLAVDSDLHDEVPQFGPKTFHDKTDNIKKGGNAQVEEKAPENAMV